MRYAPSVKHIAAPRIQHHVTEAGPPRVKGVLNVVAILEQRPMILNAKLIWGSVSLWSHPGGANAYRRDIGELALEGRDVSDLKQFVVIAGVVAAAPD